MFRGKNLNPGNIVEVQFKSFENKQSFSVIIAGSV
jgi:hypothetical protein